MAEYLLAEVLERQPQDVRRLLLRTSVLERVNGPLADVMTGRSGGERILHDLEQANAFVVSLDAARSWFRYHRLFADLLALELRRAERTLRAELEPAAGMALRWRLGQTDRVEAALAEIDGHERDAAVMRTVIAALRLAGDDPQAATVALAPAIAGSVPAGHPIWLVEEDPYQAHLRQARRARPRRGRRASSRSRPARALIAQALMEPRS